MYGAGFAGQQRLAAQRLFADIVRRGDIVLDAFAGSGSTFISADKCGRTARLIEYDPAYCEGIIKRWQAVTGKVATLAETGTQFLMTWLRRVYPRSRCRHELGR